MTTHQQLQTDLIIVTRLGHRFKASRRTVAHLDYTIAAFERIFPHARLLMVQSCYNTGVELSKGTHDYDACFDFVFSGKMPGLTQTWKWLRFQRFMRNHGWGGWWRHTGPWSSPSAWHFHGFTLPVGLEHFTTRVGLYIDGGASEGHPGSASSQLVDYLAGAQGLAGQHVSRSDRTYRPKSISQTVFNYAKWVRVHGVPTK